MIQCKYRDSRLCKHPKFKDHVMGSVCPWAIEKHNEINICPDFEEVDKTKDCNKTSR